MNPPQTDDLFVAELTGLLSECGTNKHDLGTVGITACSDGGIVTRKAIIDTLASAGLNPKHVPIVLAKDTGSDPLRHRWQRDEAGVYRNLN